MSMKMVSANQHLAASGRRGMFTDREIGEVACRKRKEIADWVRAVAAQRKVSSRRLPSDTFARAVSRLSDGVVDLDPVEELLVSLARNGILTSDQSSLLQANYLD